MNTVNSTLFVLLGISLRLIVPIALTALVVYFLRKLDVRWQAEADLERKMLVNNEASCWKEQGLTVDEANMPALKTETPCWQVFRLSNGHLCEKCLKCEVFLSAPIPTPTQKHSKAHA